MSAKSKWSIIIGSLLLAVSLSLIISSLVMAHNVKNVTYDTLLKIERILPERSGGAKDSYSSMQMPSLEINGRNVVAVLRIPELDVTLPVASSFDKKAGSSYPQRVSGSVYDGSLVVTGADLKGQLDCLKRLDLGNKLTVTDMTGAEFTYEVTEIERHKSTSDIGADEITDLTLFVKDSSSQKYVVVSCIQIP
ncbi:MAG: hypothetical protein IKL24_05430 [Clostridia bacterium]|nr:hypothetical protein [Clostridia bacterium]